MADVHDRKARRAKLTLAGIGVLVVGVLVGGGVTAYAVLSEDDTAAPKPGPSASTAGPSTDKPTQKPTMTPEKAKKLTLNVPTGQRGGASIGFPHSPSGSVSAAVYFWEEFAFLDDQKARQQLETVVSPDATGYIDEQVSEVRKLREGANLPPSGGTPAGITFTTAVNAVRARSLTSDGNVVDVWMNYNRYATKADGSPDDDPLKDETDDLIVKWQDGQWKLTNEPKYKKKRSFPAAYSPDSPYATQDGWQQVRHAD